MQFVLYASGAVELLLNTTSGKRVAKRRETAAVSIHVPHLIDMEITHVLRRYAGYVDW